MNDRDNLVGAIAAQRMIAVLGPGTEVVDYPVSQGTIHLRRSYRWKHHPHLGPGQVDTSSCELTGGLLVWGTLHDSRYGNRIQRRLRPGWTPRQLVRAVSSVWIRMDREAKRRTQVRAYERELEALAAPYQADEHFRDAITTAEETLGNSDYELMTPESFEAWKAWIADYAPKTKVEPE